MDEKCLSLKSKITLPQSLQGWRTWWAMCMDHLQDCKDVEVHEEHAVLYTTMHA